MSVASRVTRTGGRDAATRHIPPRLALAVGKPEKAPPKGWQWSALTDLARLESGHTPSRKHPEYWGGDVPWVSIGDARLHDGQRIDDTVEKTNELGIENSSARVLPTNTVCLSRTASVGYVVVMGRPMATSQDFVNWVCSEQLDHNFLKYLFIAEDEGLLRFASGAVHQTIYFPEVKAFHICHPPLTEQRRIVGVLNEAFAGLATAQAHAKKNLQNARALLESELDEVFAGRRTGWVRTTVSELIEKDGGDVQTGPFGTKLKASEYTKTGVPVISVAEIRLGKIVLHARTPRVDRAITSRMPEYVLKEGDIVFGSKGAVERSASVTAEQDGWFLGSDGIRLRLPTNCNRRFIAYQMLAPRHKQWMLSQSVGTTMPSLNQKIIQRIPVFLCSLRTQGDIVAKLDELTVETQRLESLHNQKQAALVALKKSLLHQAFSGEF